MADETDHVVDAALALDPNLGRKTVNQKQEAEYLPEDATEVPDYRDLAAIRGEPITVKSDGE